MVDAYTQIKFISFFRANKVIVEPTCTPFNKWEKGGLPINKIRCDNTGENVILGELGNGKDWKLNVIF